MTYKIEQIEGIGPQFAEKLMAAGVSTTDELLSKCATPLGRQHLEAMSGLPANRLLTWANQADLMRVPGIGSEYGQLLEQSGVDTVRELAMRNPENLVMLMERINAQRHLTRAIPAVKTVAKWVDKAKALEPVITH